MLICCSIDDRNACKFELDADMGFWIFAVLAVVSVAFVLFLGALILFEPGLRYRISPRQISIDSPEFLRLLGALCDAEVRSCDPIEVLNGGSNFYAAELAAISAASQTIHLEAYIFERGRVAGKFIETLSERARSGVRVKVVVDAIGSLLTPDSYFKPLRDAGGRVEWYQPLRLKTFKRWNNRTHRKLIVVDGLIAFAGGADIGDDWLYGDKGNPCWRDTVFCFRGNLVCGLQSTFAENWLESSGEILADDDYFPLTRQEDPAPEERSSGIVVNSTPSAARGTRAHILYQTLLAYAKTSIHITTPYFLPDRSHARGNCQGCRAARREGDHPDSRQACGSSFYASVIAAPIWRVVKSGRGNPRISAVDDSREDDGRRWSLVGHRKSLILTTDPSDSMTRSTSPCAISRWQNVSSRIFGATFRTGANHLRTLEQPIA